MTLPIVSFLLGFISGYTSPYLGLTLTWDALAAIGTISSAVVALWITSSDRRRADKKEQKIREKEAIEKLLVPMRQELDSFSRPRWAEFLPGITRKYDLDSMRLTHPLHYYHLKNTQAAGFLLENVDALDKKIQDLIVNYYAISASWTHFIIDISKDFAATEAVDEISGGQLLNGQWNLRGENINLFSLVMSDVSIDQCIPMDESSKILDKEKLKKFIDRVEEEIKQHPDLQEHRAKRRDTYERGATIIRQIDYIFRSD